jgi:hypothetical protein
LLKHNNKSRYLAAVRIRQKVFGQRSECLDNVSMVTKAIIASSNVFENALYSQKRKSVQSSDCFSKTSLAPACAAVNDGYPQTLNAVGEKTL